MKPVYNRRYYNYMQVDKIGQLTVIEWWFTPNVNPLFGGGIEILSSLITHTVIHCMVYGLVILYTFETLVQ